MPEPSLSISLKSFDVRNVCLMSAPVGLICMLTLHTAGRCAARVPGDARPGAKADALATRPAARTALFSGMADLEWACRVSVISPKEASPWNFESQSLSVFKISMTTLRIIPVVNSDSTHFRIRSRFPKNFRTFFKDHKKNQRISELQEDLETCDRTQPNLNDYSVIND